MRPKPGEAKKYLSAQVYKNVVSNIDTRTGLRQFCCMLLSYTFRMDDKIEVKDCKVREEPRVQDTC